MHPVRQIHIKSLHHDECGATILEFAIASGVLLLTLVGFFEFTYAMYSYEFVMSAAQQGARYAIVHGAQWGGVACANATSYDCTATSDDVQNYVRGLATPGIEASSLAVDTQWPQESIDGTSTGCTSQANNPGCEVKVVVQYPFGIHFPFMSGSNVTFRSTSEMTIQQ